VDASGVSTATRKLKDRMFTNSINILKQTIKKMCLVKDKKGPDFIWQVNKALELWFEKNMRICLRVGEREGRLITNYEIGEKER